MGSPPAPAMCATRAGTLRRHTRPREPARTSSPQKNAAMLGALDSTPTHQTLPRLPTYVVSGGKYGAAAADTAARHTRRTDQYTPYIRFSHGARSPNRLRRLVGTPIPPRVSGTRRGFTPTQQLERPRLPGS
jgi:hypothetical protein